MTIADHDRDDAARATDPHPDSTSNGDHIRRDRPSMLASATVLVLGIVGLVAASTLTVERFKLFVDPGYRPSCSINPILSCGSVMTTDQAAFFGFPNPLIGIAAYSVVVVAGVLAVARTQLPTWFWTGLGAATGVSLVFIGYLIVQSLYRIGALCPYCMVVWAITPLLFVVTAQIAARSSGRPEIVWATGWLRPVLVVFYVAVIVMIGVRFWDYWSTLP